MSNSGDSELAQVINPLGNLTGPPASRLMTASAKADAPGDGWGGTVEASQTGKPTFKPGLETSALAAIVAETAAGVARSLTLYDWKSRTNVSFGLDDYPLVAAHCNQQDLGPFTWSPQAARENIPSLERCLAGFEDPGKGLQDLQEAFRQHFPPTSSFYREKQPGMIVPDFLKSFPHAVALSQREKDKFYTYPPSYYLSKVVSLAPKAAVQVIEVAAGGRKLEQAAALWTKASEGVPQEQWPALASHLAFAASCCERDEHALEAVTRLQANPELLMLARQLPNERGYLPYQLRGLQACLQSGPPEAALAVVSAGAYWNEAQLAGYVGASPERADAAGKLFASRNKDRDASVFNPALQTLQDLQLLDSVRGDESLGSILNRFMTFRTAHGRDWESLVARTRFLELKLHEPERFARFAHYLPFCRANRNVTFSRWEPATQAAELETKEHPLYDAGERREILSRLMEQNEGRFFPTSAEFQAVTARRHPGQSLAGRMDILLSLKARAGSERAAAELFARIDSPDPGDAQAAALLLLEARKPREAVWRVKDDLALCEQARQPGEALSQTAARLAAIFKHEPVDGVAKQLFEWSAAHPTRRLDLDGVVAHPTFELNWDKRRLDLFLSAPEELGAALSKLANLPEAHNEVLKHLETLLAQRPGDEPLTRTAERYARLLAAIPDAETARKRLEWVGPSAQGQEALTRVAEVLPRREQIATDAALWLQDAPGDPRANLDLMVQALSSSKGDLELAKAAFKPRITAGVEVHEGGVTVGGVRLRKRT